MCPGIWCRGIWLHACRNTVCLFLVDRETFPDEHRDAARATLDGLTDGEARGSLVPSATTVLGLVKHLTLVETIWFTELLTGVSRAELGLPATPADSFVLEPRDTVDSIRRGYEEACARSREAIRSRP